MRQLRILLGLAWAWLPLGLRLARAGLHLREAGRRFGQPLGHPGVRAAVGAIMGPVRTVAALLAVMPTHSRWLAAGMAAALLVALLPVPVDLAVEGRRMLALALLFVVIYITGALPMGASILLVLTWVVAWGVKPPAEAIGAVPHDAGFFIMGALMIARVLIRHNLHRRLVAAALTHLPPGTASLVTALVAIAALASTVMSDHTVAALLLPIGTTLVMAAGGMGRHPNLARVVMLGITYGCALGGLATPSGGSRNVVMIGFLEELAGIRVGYGHWVLLGLPITLLSVPLVALILLRTFPPEVANLKGARRSLLEDTARLGPMSRAEGLVTLVFLAILAGWVFFGRQLGMGVVALGGALLYLIMGLATWEEDYQHINWGIVWLYFAAVAFGRTLDDSGGAAWLADRLLGLGGQGQVGLTVSAVLIMTLFTQTMSDGPAVALLGPVVLAAAGIGGVDPLVVGPITAMASSFAFMMIIGTPSNAIVYSSGFLQPRDFLRAGLRVTAACLVVLFLVTGLWWPVLTRLGG